MPATQSVSALHVVLHAVLPQTYGEQTVVPATGQLPAPVQVTAAVARPFVHDAAPQLTDAAACVQAPAPLQVPVLPQVPLATQRVCGSITPVPTGEQVPTPFRLHARQVPHEPVVQQTPSTQLLLEHSWVAPQVAPLPLRGTQLPPVPVQ